MKDGVNTNIRRLNSWGYLLVQIKSEVAKMFSLQEFSEGSKQYSYIRTKQDNLFKLGKLQIEEQVYKYNSNRTGSLIYKNKKGA